MHREPTLGALMKKTVSARAGGLSKALVARAKQGVGAAATSLSHSLK